MSNCVVMARLHIAGVSRHATDNRECHGVALAGHDECAAGAGTSCARAEEKDYPGDAWIIVEKGKLHDHQDAEHVFPLRLAPGLCTRSAALGLPGVTAVIEIFEYQDAWPTHLSWAALLPLVAKGGGTGRWTR
jgi:hypothetical protein